jgi:hypothetical protein
VRVIQHRQTSSAHTRSEYHSAVSIISKLRRASAAVAKSGHMVLQLVANPGVAAAEPTTVLTPNATQANQPGVARWSPVPRVDVVHERVDTIRPCLLRKDAVLATERQTLQVGRVGHRCFHRGDEVLAEEGSSDVRSVDVVTERGIGARPVQCLGKMDWNCAMPSGTGSQVSRVDDLVVEGYGYIPRARSLCFLTDVMPASASKSVGCSTNKQTTGFRTSQLCSLLGSA